jgi:hypothetical protein
VKVRLISSACNHVDEIANLRANPIQGLSVSSINTRLQPGAKADQTRSRFNGFPAESKLLKQFFVSVTACTGLKPGVTGKQPLYCSISLIADLEMCQSRLR